MGATLRKDPRHVTLHEKQKLAQEYNEIMLRHSDRIVSTQTRYTDSFREVTFANSEGAYVVEERPDVTLALSAMARGDGTRAGCF